jgi:hypothetical protein
MAQSIRIRRTPTANNPPVGLADGELAVEQNSPLPRLWVGVTGAPDGRRAIAGDNIYLPLTGGTLTGPLQINAPLRIVGADLTIDRTPSPPVGQAIGAVNFSSGAQTRAVFQAVATDTVAGASFSWLATRSGETTPRPTMTLSANGDLALTAAQDSANFVGLVSYTNQLLPPGYLTLRGRVGAPGQLAPVLEGDVLGGFWCDGQFGNAPADNTDSAGASLNASATEDWNPTATGSRWNFRGVPRLQRGSQLFAALDETGFIMPVSSRLQFGATWEMGVGAADTFFLRHPASHPVVPVASLTFSGLLTISPPGTFGATVYLTGFIPNDPATAPGFGSVRGRGTPEIPLPVLGGDILGGWWCGAQWGSNLGDTAFFDALVMRGVATQPWSDPNRGCAWEWFATPNDSANSGPVPAMRLDGNGDLRIRRRTQFGPGTPTSSWEMGLFGNTVLRGETLDIRHRVTGSSIAFDPAGGFVVTPEDDFGAIIYATGFSDDPATPPGFGSLRARGTQAVPLPVRAGDALGGWWCGGRWGDQPDNVNRWEALTMQGFAVEDWDATSQGCGWFWYAIPKGSATVRLAMTLEGEGTLNLNGGNLNFLGASSNMITWPVAGVGPPTAGTRSSGTKLVLFPGAGTDYALGIEGGTLWYSGGAHRWYDLTPTSLMVLDNNVGVARLTLQGPSNTIAFAGVGVNTSNVIIWPAAGLGPPVAGAPAFRSLGTRLVLYPNQVPIVPGPLSCDYALGMESGFMWHAAAGFRWYRNVAPIQSVMELDGNGNLQITGNLTAGNFPLDLADRLDALEARLATLEARRS